MLEAAICAVPSKLARWWWYPGRRKVGMKAISVLPPTVAMHKRPGYNSNISAYNTLHGGCRRAVPRRLPSPYGLKLAGQCSRNAAGGGSTG